MKRSLLALLLGLLFVLLFIHLQRKPDRISIPKMAGRYVMSYTPEKGWDYNQINRVESLEIKADSTYYWELILPRGCIPVYPEVGKIRLSQDTIHLESGRAFISLNGELYQTHCVSQPELKNVPWKKEN